MSRFLYEQSVTHQEYLIIPFVYSSIDSHNIYSYCLLSARGYRDRLHQATNPAGLYSSKLRDIQDIARQHLEAQIYTPQESDYFEERYTYNYNLIIIHQAAEKYFYDHYAPDKLTNIAAPKLFSTHKNCIKWIKQGLKRRKVT